MQLTRVFLIVLALFFLTAMSSIPDNVITGTVFGQINYCAKGGHPGLQVYIPGKPYTVITGEDGTFTFYNVKTGVHVIRVSKDGNLMEQSQVVEVLASRSSNAGVIKVCETEKMTMPTNANSSKNTAHSASLQDLDGDSFVVGSDCDDTNPKVFPGAIEICDGLDNNCDGEIDNAPLFQLAHADGRCDAGKIQIERCIENYADCDKMPINGCEVNLSNDQQNCGSCGNVCSDLDSCQLGMC